MIGLQVYKPIMIEEIESVSIQVSLINSQTEGSVSLTSSKYASTQGTDVGVVNKNKLFRLFIHLFIFFLFFINRFTPRSFCPQWPFEANRAFFWPPSGYKELNLWKTSFLCRAPHGLPFQIRAVVSMRHTEALASVV